MARITTKIAFPIILVGIFVVAVFAALNVDYQGPIIGSLIVFFLLCVFIFFFGLAIGQSMSSPVRRILTNANELSKGNLSSRVYLETKDELAELGNTFNKIAEELEVSRQQQANIEKAVDIKVKAKTQELEETIHALDQKVKNRTIELERATSEAEKMQIFVKVREEEIADLKNELKAINQKLARPKKAAANTAEDIKV